MSKILVVTYSYTGCSRRLAEVLCSLMPWTSAEVVEVRARNGWRGTWRCVFDSLFRRKPPIKYSGPDLLAFDAVVLISPVWLYRLAGPMRSFIALHKQEMHDVVLISVMGGSGAPNAAAEAGRLLGRAPLLSTAFTSREVEDGSCAGRLLAFGKAVQEAEDSVLVARPTVLSPRAA